MISDEWRKPAEADSKHGRAMCGAHWNAGWVEMIQAMHVNAEMVGCDAFAVESIDAAGLAEEMMCRLRMKLVFAERFGAGQQGEVAFVHLDHQRILHPAQRAIAGSQLREVGRDLKPDRAAVAAAGITL